MNRRQAWIYLCSIAVACFASLLCTAQPGIKTFVDKSEILIGEQFKLRVEADFSPDAYKLRWLNIPDSLQHFEVIGRSKIDSVYTSNILSGITQTFTLTSFDSGKWNLPSFLVGIDPVKDDTSFNYFTDSVPITVSFSVSDTTSQLRDIKPIREIEVFNPIWYWLGGGVLLAILVALLIWLYSKRKKVTPAVIPVQSKLSPYEEAMQELKLLRTRDASHPDEIKIIHTRVAEIVKHYLSRKQHANFLNNTTGDILLVLRDAGVNKEMLSTTAAALRSGDAVKFAKYLPATDETTAAITTITSLIEFLNQNDKPNAVKAKV